MITPWMARLHARLSSLRPLRNAGILALGRGVQGILSLAYIMLATRALGPADFGVLTLMHALMMLAAQVVRFQSWQAILRYGAPALREGDLARLQRLILFALWLDWVSAAFAYGLLLVTLPHLLAFAGIPAAYTELGRLYAVAVVFLIVGSGPLGLLRLLDRHDLVSWQTTVEPLVRCIGAAVLFCSAGALPQFLLVWLLASVLGRLALFVAARRALAARALSLRGCRLDRRCLAPEPGIWRFTLGTNLSSTLNLSDTQVGPLLAGNLLGVGEAGLYRVAQQVSNAISKPVNKLLVPAIYTDLAALTAAGEWARRKAMVRHSNRLAGLVTVAVFALLVVAGKPLLGVLFGAPFEPAYAAMLWFAFAGVLGTFTFALAPLLVSHGRVRPVLFTRLAALSCYLAAFYALVPGFGLAGAGVAVNVQAVVTALLLSLFARALSHGDGAPREAR